MDIDFNLHDLYQDDRYTADEEGIDLKPGANDEAANNNDDGDVIQIQALANQLLF